MALPKDVKEHLEELVKSEGHKKILQYLNNRFGEDAEDYLQEAYTEHLENPSSASNGLKRGSSIEAIVTNRAKARGINSQKKDSRLLPSEELPEQTLKPIQDELVECKNIIQKAIHKTDLPTKDLELFVRKEVSGATYQELASHSQKSLGFVQGRLQKTLRLLQTMFTSLFAFFFRTERARAIFRTAAILILSTGLTLVAFEGFSGLILPKTLNASAPTTRPTKKRSKKKTHVRKKKTASRKKTISVKLLKHTFPKGGIIKRFPIQAKVTTGTGKGLKGVIVELDGKRVGKTNAKGIFTGTFFGKVGAHIKIKVIGMGKDNWMQLKTRLRVRKKGKQGAVIPVRIEAFLRAK